MSNLDLSRFTNDKALEVAKKIDALADRTPQGQENPVWWVDGKRVFKGNLVQPLVHGNEFCQSLLEAITNARNYIFLTAWAFSPSFRLQRKDNAKPDGNPESTSISGSLLEALKRKVAVRIIIWDIPTIVRMFEREAAMSIRALSEMRIPTRVVSATDPTLHEKCVVVDGRIGFCGGMDLSYLGGDRWDTEEHRHPDIRRVAPAEDAGPWHDVQVRVTGPAVLAIQQTFLDRWAEAASQFDGVRIPQLNWNPPVAGGASVEAQVIRTLPPRVHLGNDPLVGDSSEWGTFGTPRRRGSLRQPDEEDYSTLESYGRAIVNARRFIYIENQYITCTFLMDLMKQRLVRNVDLSLIMVIPSKSELHVPNDAPLLRKARAGLSSRAVGEHIDVAKIVRKLREIAPGQVFVAYPFNPDNKGKEAIKDVYVHAKVLIVDDVFAIVGSANLSDRSMFRTDQELGLAWHDPKGTSVRDLRRKLWKEHLGLKDDELEKAEQNAKPLASLWIKRAVDKTWEKKRIAEWNLPAETPVKKR